MKLRLWWWRKIREADIPQDQRDTFERFGQEIIASILTGGFTPRHVDLQMLYNDIPMLKNAAKWLTEQGDRREQREQRLETVEWSILILIVVSVFLGILILALHN